VTLAEALALAWGLTYALGALTVPSVLLRREARPMAAVSWILALLTVPALALPGWWLLGRTHLSRRRQRRQRAHAAFSAELERDRGGDPNAEAASARLLAVVKAPRELQEWVFPPSAGNIARLLTPPDAFKAWEQAIRGAKRHVHALFYIWRDDEVGRKLRDALVERARAGVEVRVLYDHVGCLGIGRHFAPLTAAGAQVVPYLPLRLLTRAPVVNFRNHRKLLVVDGEVGYVGGINVGAEYLDWFDLAAELRGPAVDQLQEVFADDWHFAATEALTESTYFPWAGGSSDPAGTTSCAVVASGPDQRLNATREMLFLAVTRAQERAWFMTPYLVPDEALTAALRAAVYGGADVRLVVPARSDVGLVRRAARVYYPELLEAGVRVFEYDGMLHAKAALFDADLALVGSANLDSRSFRYNFEVVSFLQGEEIAGQLRDTFQSAFARSSEVELEAIRRRWVGARVVDAAAHLLSPLL